MAKSFAIKSNNKNFSTLFKYLPQNVFYNNKLIHFNIFIVMVEIINLYLELHIWRWLVLRIRTSFPKIYIMGFINIAFGMDYYLQSRLCKMLFLFSSRGDRPPTPLLRTKRHQGRHPRRVQFYLVEQCQTALTPRGRHWLKKVFFTCIFSEYVNASSDKVPHKSCNYPYIISQ